MNLHDRDITRAAKKDGIAEGIIRGEQRKAIEDAVILINKYHATPEAAAQDMNIPLELVLQKLKILRP